MAPFRVRSFRFPGNRQQNKASAADAALQMLLEYLEGNRDLEHR